VRLLTGSPQTVNVLGGAKMVMKSSRAILISLSALFVARTVLALPVSVTLVPEDFNNLLSDSPSAIGTPLITNMSLGNLKSEVVSQAFTDGAGNYAYLYQVKNTGTTGNSAIEIFTCSPFFGASALTTLGYLTANLPTGFTLGNQLSDGVSVDPAAGPTVSFGFPAWLGQAIDPGEASTTFYVVSSGVPGKIVGNVIDGTIASGEVVGSVPEPATLLLFGLGGLAVVRKRRAV
jgi:hypothetical protein